MTDPRMISGLEMLSSDEPSSEHSRVTGGSSVVTVLTDVTPEPGHSSLSSLHVRHSVSAAELQTSGLGQVPLVSGCLLSSQSLTHSSQLSQLSLTKTRGSWCLVSVHSCSRQSPASSPCPALPRPAATAKGSVRPNWVWPPELSPAPCGRILKFSTHGNDSSHTRDTVIRWGPAEDRRHKVTDLAAAAAGVWQVYD